MTERTADDDDEWVYEHRDYVTEWVASEDQTEAVMALDLRYTVEPDPVTPQVHILDNLMHRTVLTFGGDLALEYANKAMYDLNVADNAGEQPSVDWLPIARRSNGQDA